MTIAAPENDEERAKAALLEQGYDAGWADAIEECAKVADRHAASCDRGSPVSSMAEDAWGAVAAREIADAIRALITSTKESRP